mgnify:CR=1 FL=1
MTIFHFNPIRTGFLSLAICGFATSTALADTDQYIPVPSGQSLSFIEFLSENDGKVVRFRFLTPEIGETYAYMDVAPDFQAVCDEQVMPVLDANALVPTQIVLSMSAADIPFGEDNPDVLQFFEIFRPENGTCIWEEF